MLSTHCGCTKFQIAMYSKDLRWRVISLKYQCRFSNRRIARLLDMHKSTVKRILRKFLLTGDVQCFKVGRPNISSLHVYEQFVLVEAALKDPSMTLEELLWEIQHSTGSQYCLSTVKRNLRRFGFTFKQVGVTSCRINIFSVFLPSIPLFNTQSQI